jgi:gas vesicle protein
MDDVDQGIVGLIGTAVGGAIGVVGTLVGVRQTGREQRRSQHELWRRQVRRDAYSQFITQAQAVIDAGNLASNDLPTVQADHVDELQRAEDRLWAVRNTVMLEGPDIIVEAADRVYDVVQGWTAALRTVLLDPEPDRVRSAASSATWAGAEAEDALEGLGKACQALLDEWVSPQ